MAEQGGGHQRCVLDAHAVVDFVALFESAQDGDGVFDRGLAHQHLLEAPLQRRVALDVLLVFVQGGGADATQLAACQRRLQHVGGVDGAFGRACAHQRVQLVDEEDDLPVGLFDLFQQRFEAVFELAPVLRAGDQGGQVERYDALGLEDFRHVAGGDALRQSFDDGGLADAGLADQDRVVLGAAGEHLDDATNFIVAADDGVELAAAGELGQVAGVALQCLVLGFRVGVGDALAAAHGFQRFQHRLARDPVGGEQALRRLAALLRQRQQ